MKHISKKSALGLFLLTVAVLIGCVNAILITVDTDYSKLHKIRLHTLNVGSGDDYARFMVGEDQDILWFSSGLRVGDNIPNRLTADDGVFQGGGKYNKFSGGSSGKYSGIGGGVNNEIVFANPEIGVVIGGGYQNVAHNDSSVVLGGRYNYVFNGGVIVGGYDNNVSTRGVSLGGQHNRASNFDNLVFGSGSRVKANSFSWNANNDKERSARIDASSGVLIGTYTGIDGVNLVVNGAMKIDSRSSLGGDGIEGQVVVVNGCFYAYDGHNWYVINKGGGCADSMPEGFCMFGNVILLDGESMSGYLVPFDKDCASKEREVVCNDGNLEGGIYPYCYKLS